MCINFIFFYVDDKENVWSGYCYYITITKLLIEGTVIVILLLYSFIFRQRYPYTILPHDLEYKNILFYLLVKTRIMCQLKTIARLLCVYFQVSRGMHHINFT